jgi:formate dehydrogenase major subunit
MVVMDPLATDTSEFWKPHGEFNDVDPTKIQTEVFRLPTTCFAETDGTSPTPAASAVALEGGRWSGRGEGRHRDHGRPVPQAEGNVRQGRRRLPGPDPQPDLGLQPAGQAVARRTAEGDQRQGAGRRARSERPDQGAGQGRRAAAGFAQLRDDGSTSLRQLDLLRLLVAGRQPWRGATTATRPASARR